MNAEYVLHNKLFGLPHIVSDTFVMEHSDLCQNCTDTFNIVTTQGPVM